MSRDQRDEQFAAWRKQERIADGERGCTGCRHNIRGEHKVKEHPSGQLYYVQDTRQIVGNCVLWWNPRGAGYTTQIDKAGLYTAARVSQMRPTDVGWPKEFVDTRVSNHVHLDSLQQGETVKTIPGGTR